MLKKKHRLQKYDALTSFQVVGRKNDWKMVYVSNLAKKFNLDSCHLSGQN